MIEMVLEKSKQKGKPLKMEKQNSIVKILERDTQKKGTSFYLDFSK
jgi:hypothetical protein